MRYAEIENGEVRYVLPAELSDDYTVLPPNSVEILLGDDVQEGDRFIDGKFVRPTAEELAASVPKETVKFTFPLTDAQRDEILIELAYQYNIEPK